MQMTEANRKDLNSFRKHVLWTYRNIMTVCDYVHENPVVLSAPYRMEIFTNPTLHVSPTEEIIKAVAENPPKNMAVVIGSV